MKSRAIVVVLLAAVLSIVVVGAQALQQRAEAQGLPELRTAIYQGNVTVNGEPAPDGFRLTAKVRNSDGDVIYTSAEAIVGKSVPSRYTALVIGPAPEAEGGVIEFWLDDQVISTNVSVFAPLLGGRICLGCSWTLPLLRSQDLEFSSLPIATPTPTPSPTPTAIVLLPSLYSGQVLAGSSIPPDGTPIFAIVGDYISPFATIENGRYQLVVNPIEEDFLNAQVIFFIGELRAVQSVPFKGNEFLESYNLIFPNLPPTPTPTLVPTSTPEPTRTPTPVPTPSPTATPTVTPTPIGSGEATVQPTATQEADDSGGGSCNATHAGGPASGGIVALFALPFALLLSRRLMRSGQLPQETD